LFSSVSYSGSKPATLESNSSCLP